MTVDPSNINQNSGSGRTEDAPCSILVLALGNDIMGDDAVGLHAAKALRKKFSNRITIIEAMIAGYSLLDILDGYSHVLLIDAVTTGKSLPGAIREFSKEEFETLYAASPHYVGIPEVLTLAKRLGLQMPVEFRILAMEISDTHELRECLSPKINEALPKFIQYAEDIIRGWLTQ